MNKGLFLLLYLMLFISTYVVRYVVMMYGGSVGYSYSMPDNINFLGSAEKILLCIYIIMTIISYIYGRKVGKRYLLVFPFAAGIFDTFFLIVMFVPTILNLAGFIIGATSHPINHKIK